MRPSSLGGGRIMRRTLSVCLSVRPVIVAIGYVFSAPLASRMYFSARTEGRISYGHLGRTDYCLNNSVTHHQPIITHGFVSCSIAFYIALFTTSRNVELLRKTFFIMTIRTAAAVTAVMLKFVSSWCSTYKQLLQRLRSQ